MGGGKESEKVRRGSLGQTTWTLPSSAARPKFTYISAIHYRDPKKEPEILCLQKTIYRQLAAPASRDELLR